MQLLRAEASLTVLQARQFAVRAAGALLATCVALAFLQLAAILAVLWPVLSGVVSAQKVLMSVGASAALGVMFAFVALCAWAAALRSNASALVVPKRLAASTDVAHEAERPREVAPIELGAGAVLRRSEGVQRSDAALHSDAALAAQRPGARAIRA
jgi:hypothetical protein